MNPQPPQPVFSVRPKCGHPIEMDVNTHAHAEAQTDWALNKSVIQFFFSEHELRP
jgi:hypothetical protein